MTAEVGRPAIDADLARRLVAAQFPQWAHLQVRPVEHGGWDNRTFHLGDELTVRLPSARRYAAQAEKEHAWLPRLAPHLPAAIPQSVALGAPGEGFPWPWSVRRWIAGETAKAAPPADAVALAEDLAGFLAALQDMDATAGPEPGAHNFWRGGPLATYDAESRRAVEVLGKRVDAAAALAVWEAALASAWTGPPVWIHGDVAPGNLIVRDGRLAAVIDFGGLGAGDPACDLVMAWTYFQGEARAAFRARLSLDAATWARARGWALWKALILAAGFSGDHPDASASWAVIEEVLANR